MTLCQCGCGKPAPLARQNYPDRGIKKGDPCPYRQGHAPSRVPNPYRFDINKETGCWDWTGFVEPNGYGQVRVNKIAYRAHRFIYEQAYGEIPAGHEAHHTCHNKGCVNPEHLRIVTKDEHAGGKGHGKLTREDAREIREIYATGNVMQKDIAETFGVCASFISEIVSGRKWKAA